MLLDCLKRDEPVDPGRLATLSRESWHALMALAATQRVRPLFWHRLKQKGLAGLLPAEVAEELREASRRNTMHNMLRYGELRRLLAALKAEGIPLILLKGIYLAGTVYENMGLREMNDVDVLARPADLMRIADTLAGLGYASPQPICPNVTLATNHHLPPMVKGGLTFEVHWNLTYPGESCTIDPACLWECAVPVRIAGREALALSPEDLLLHLCLHTSHHHQFAFGLRPFCDIAATIAHFGSTLDWRSITEQADRRRWGRGVYLALRLARELAGAEVPDDILERLRPADTTEAILDAVRAQVFCDKGIAVSITTSFAALLESRSVIEQIRIFWQRVFQPRAMLAASYGVPMDSARIYCCYPRRIFELLCRYRHSLREYRQNDTPLNAIVQRKNRISNWLAGPDADDPWNS